MRETPAEGDVDQVERPGSPGAPAQVSRSRRRGSFTGEKIGGNRVIAVQGLLNSGVSKSRIAKDLKISRNSVIAIEQRMKAEGIANPQRVEAIKQTFRAKATLILDDALAAVNTRKLRGSSAADCMKVAERAVQMAGLAEKPSGLHGQLLALQQFNLKAGLPSVSTLDLASIPPKQPHMLASEAEGGSADGDGPAQDSP